MVANRFYSYALVFPTCFVILSVGRRKLPAMSTVRVPVGTDWRALAAVSTTVLAWASAFVAIRWVGESFSAAPLAAGRLIVGSALLGGALLVTRSWVRPTRREWVLLTVCGLAWFAIYNIALNAGEQRIDESTPLPRDVRALEQMTGVARPWEEAAQEAPAERQHVLRADRAAADDDVIVSGHLLPLLGWRAPLMRRSRASFV